MTDLPFQQVGPFRFDVPRQFADTALIYPMNVLDDRVLRGLWARLHRESRERTPYQTNRKAS